MNDWIYDIETYPNCFLLCAVSSQSGEERLFEISDSRNDYPELREWVLALKRDGCRMVGFNNVGFDYPVLHFLLVSGGVGALALYERAMAIIESNSRWGVKPSDCWVPQIDLFKIHHFDNKARTTSLKALEFNMRLLNISDLPFPVGTYLELDQMDMLATYCRNDVVATLEFYERSKDQIAFREQLTKRYERNFLNASDVKIGKDIFQLSLESAGVTCYDYDPTVGRTPRQTLRTSINLADCIPPYVHFETVEFNRVKQFLENTTIVQTKGALADLTATVGGLEFKFGTGGLHASVEGEWLESNAEMVLRDVDVTSLYPSIAIENNLYPEHLGSKFVEVYRRLREQRVGYAKGTPENAMLKLALNGVYGASNDPYSIFYDPLFTMRITISGQLLLAMLAERLLTVPGLRIIQVNTDGVTVYLPRDHLDKLESECVVWESLTRLHLEHVEFDCMAIADVNNYIARKVGGGVKRKGRYEYKTEWHQNASALVVPKVAEKVLLEDAPIRETVESWPDCLDFMLRVKVPRGSRLIGVDGRGEHELENTQRYYIAKGGMRLVKIMPPLAKKPDEYRRIDVQSGWTVCPCNYLLDGNMPVDFDWYVNEVNKLVLGVM